MQLRQRLALSYIRTKFKLLASFSKKKAAAKAFELFCTPQHRNTKKLPPVFEKGEPLEFALEHYIVRGFRWNRGAGKRALILHGFESGIVNFDRYIKELIKKGYEVLAFDAPAHGRSTGKTINAPTYKEMVKQILSRYGRADAFIAHSFGGLIISLVLEEEAHDANTKLVLIAPAVETTTAVDQMFKLLQLDAGVRAEFDALILSIGGHPTGWYSISRAAQHIKASVLFLQDRDDHMTPMKDVEPIMNKNYPNFRFVISSGLGHRRIYRDAGSVKTITEFL